MNTISRLLVCGVVALGCATAARAEDGVTAPRIAAVHATEARVQPSRRPAAPVLLSVEIVPEPAANGAPAPRCDTANASQCGQVHAAAPVIAPVR